jgi:hypothetical protein
MVVLRVGDRVDYESKTWRVESLGRRALLRRGAKTINGELYAMLLLEADLPGSKPTYRIVVPESRWDEARLLEK